MPDPETTAQPTPDAKTAEMVRKGLIVLTELAHHRIVEPTLVAGATGCTISYRRTSWTADRDTLLDWLAEMAPLVAAYFDEAGTPFDDGAMAGLRWEAIGVRVELVVLRKFLVAESSAVDVIAEAVS